jgi:hypothetical protein
MDFIATLMTRDNAMLVGISLLALGLIWYLTPRLLLKSYDAREMIKQQAQQLGLVDELARIKKTENAARRLSFYSKALIVTGIIILIAVFTR